MEMLINVSHQKENNMKKLGKVLLITLGVGALAAGTLLAVGYVLTEKEDDKIEL